MPAEFLLIAGVLVIETIVSGRWVEFYFRSGIPVFRSAVILPLHVRHNLSADEIERRCRGGWGPRLLFRELSTGDVAFREAAELSFFSYTPIMHGLLTKRPTERVVVVSGHLNWFIIAVVLMLAGRWDEFGELWFAPVLILGMLYGIQAMRYKKVGEAVMAASNDGGT